MGCKQSCANCSYVCVARNTEGKFMCGKTPNKFFNLSEMLKCSCTSWKAFTETEKVSFFSPLRIKELKRILHLKLMFRNTNSDNSQDLKTYFICKSPVGEIIPKGKKYVKVDRGMMYYYFAIVANMDSIKDSYEIVGMYDATSAGEAVNTYKQYLQQTTTTTLQVC